MSSPNDLFDPADFESVVVEIHLKNLSTGKIVREYEQIAIIEVSDQAVTFAVPFGYCFKENHVLFEMYQGEELLLSSTARVEDATDALEGLSLVRLSLIQFDKKSWAHFIQIFSKRQEEIQRFFEMGKK